MTNFSNKENDNLQAKEQSANFVSDCDDIEANNQSDKGALAIKTKAKKNKSLLKTPISKLFIFVMLFIPCLYWLIFYAYVNLSSFAMAFQDIAGKWSLDNFSELWFELNKPNGLSVALLNTLKYFVTSTCITFPLTVVMCYFFFKRIWGYKVFRFIIYLPSIIAAIVTTAVFKRLVQNNGAIGILLSNLGMVLPADGLLNDPSTATNTIVAYTMWTGLCSNMLIVSGSLARIPIEVLESARLDGVGAWKELVRIVVPLIWPTLATLLLLQMTGILSATGPILLLLGNGATEKGATTLSYWIFMKVWSNGNGNQQFYGVVSAAGLCFTIVLIPVVYGFRALTKLVPSVEY